MNRFCRPRGSHNLTHWRRLEFDEKSGNLSAASLSFQPTTGDQSLLHTQSACLPVDCKHLGCVCVCVSEPHSLWFTAHLTLSPFCLLVSYNREGGHNGWLQSVINLHTSYLCLQLQGEAYTVANMINPLPLVPNPLHTPSYPHPPSTTSSLQGKKTGHRSHLGGKERSNFI